MLVLVVGASDNNNNNCAIRTVGLKARSLDSSTTGTHFNDNNKYYPYIMCPCGGVVDFQTLSHSHPMQNLDLLRNDRMGVWILFFCNPVFVFFSDGVGVEKTHIHMSVKNCKKSIGYPTNTSKSVWKVSDDSVDWI